eukprot:TRINITY_DN1186_c3_g1_i3.p1 TRINITY_DN1186_c3_g1~~TRINITY_DN1186_c3_g1_i3.p1  ORF type:complete len:354 (-),score=78.49 TRINITY_DN1186_c3_g1_i3:60-971(-)
MGRYTRSAMAAAAGRGDGGRDGGRVTPLVCGGVFLGVLGGLSAWRFYRLNERSELLRSIDQVPIRTIREGDYVKVMGTLECASPVTSPERGISCAQYECVTVRVFDTRTTRSSWGASKESSKRKDESRNKKTTSKVKGETKREKWKTSEEVISRAGEQAVCYINDGTGRVRLSLDGALHLNLETVRDDFEEADRRVETNSTQRTIGFKKQERVLRCDTRVLVYAEVGRDATTGDFVLRKAVPPGMLARERTARLRPFFVTPMSEGALIEAEENGARIYLGVAAACGVASLAALVYGGVCWLRA